MKWRKISTAPKDKYILVCRVTCGEIFCSVAIYDSLHSCFVSVVENSGHEFSPWESQQLYEYARNGYNECAFIAPTHWMPLPEPPS